jgi:hypothetical protein
MFREVESHGTHPFCCIHLLNSFVADKLASVLRRYLATVLVNCFLRRRCVLTDLHAILSQLFFVLRLIAQSYQMQILTEN